MEKGREEAGRRLLNRLKFGSEFLFITPFVLVQVKEAKLLKRGKDLAYSNSAFERWVDKYIGSPFRPRGFATVFESEMAKPIKSKILQSKRIVENITKEVDEIS